MKKIEIKLDFNEFIGWAIDKEIFYGDNIVIWWKERGCKDFIDWAEKKGIEYIDENTLKDNLTS